jgi:hypothetical protein
MLLFFTFVFATLSDLLSFSEIGSYSLSGYFALPEVKLLFPVLANKTVLNAHMEKSIDGSITQLTCLQL